MRGDSWKFCTPGALFGLALRGATEITDILRRRLLDVWIPSQQSLSQEDESLEQDLETRAALTNVYA